MWSIKPAPIPVQFLSYSQPPPPPRNHSRRFHNIPTKSQSPDSESVGILGKQILIRSSESNRNKPVEKEKEISGSDVLWAIQRATAQKKNKKKKMKKITAVSSSTVEDNGVVDYSNVKPLRIKSDWGERLEKLHKVFQEIQDTEI